MILPHKTITNRNFNPNQTQP